MEASATAQFSTVPSHHFLPSSSLSIHKVPLTSSIFPRSSSSWTCAAGNSFTRQVRGAINSKSRREMRDVVRAEMFGQLTSGLETAWNKLKGEDDEEREKAYRRDIKGLNSGKGLCRYLSLVTGI
ncbi:hypothetical protein ACS0TY_019535 [Phlomoides rotata]